MRGGALSLVRMLSAELGPSRPETTLLDIGCGTGDLAAYLTQHFSKVVGIDADPESVAQAQSRFRQMSGLEFQLANADNLGTAGIWQEQFDCIVSILALHHMQIGPLLEWSKSHLHAGGRLLIADIYADHKASFSRYLLDQFCWSTIRHICGVLESSRVLGILNVARYVLWRAEYSMTTQGRHHIQTDLRRGVPATLQEWLKQLNESLPGGSMRLIPASTFIFSWRK